ncbi:hypothetical protein PR202_ga20277 [Eleusine coracana subsp. coracana]|uniref:Protein kinase domain-containing protein n=1 Tax=Eleusine coracana subsp. coracana TaxID=191504 RepID=A0AAV5CXT4_ELECO|nr:hypothetical protein PR202_ga20277 [Eleusine coracana subsp. coracana]
MPAWWPAKLRSKAKAKPGAAAVSAGSSPRNSADFGSPSPSPSPTPRSKEKARSLDNTAAPRCRGAHGAVGYKLPVPVSEPEPEPLPLSSLYEDVAAGAGDGCSSASESSACSLVSLDEAQDQQGYSENGQFCAIKEVQVIMDDPHSKERLKQLNQEIDMLRQLSHPNIVQYYGSELTDEALSIYLEYVSGGSIHKLLREYGPFKEPVIRNYTGQILAGLASLHGRNTVHRDIKGANILVGPNGEVKLADFGMAKHISSFAEIRSFKGSPYWMAPEVIMNSKGYNLAVDIWSLGCTIIEMATARPPWHQYEGVAAIFKIANSKDIPEIPDSFSEEGKSFLQLCLKRDPASRASAAQLMDHPFVQDHPAVKAAKSSALRNALSSPADCMHTMSNREFPSRKIITPLKDIGGLSARDFTGFSTAVPSPHTSRYCDISLLSAVYTLLHKFDAEKVYPAAVLFL